MQKLNLASHLLDHSVLVCVLVNQKRGVTPSTALRLAKFFGMSADFWLNLQVRWDLHRAQLSESKDLEMIEGFHHVQKMA